MTRTMNARRVAFGVSAALATVLALAGCTAAGAGDGTGDGMGHGRHATGGAGRRLRANRRLRGRQKKGERQGGDDSPRNVHVHLRLL